MNVVTDRFGAALGVLYSRILFADKIVA